jgi:hypothetical protein
LWTNYGEKIPGFDGDSALDALILFGIEAKRAEYERKHPKQSEESSF